MDGCFKRNVKNRDRFDWVEIGMILNRKIKNNKKTKKNFVMKIKPLTSESFENKKLTIPPTKTKQQYEQQQNSIINNDKTAL